MSKVENLLKTFSPEAQAIANDYAKLRVEVKLLKAALSESQKNHAHMIVFLVAVLRQMPGYSISFKREDFEAYQAFKDSWVLKSEYVQELEEQRLTLVERGEV
jgi:hypothetical protein